MLRWPRATVKKAIPNPRATRSIASLSAKAKALGTQGQSTAEERPSTRKKRVTKIKWSDLPALPQDDPAFRGLPLDWRTPPQSGDTQPQNDNKPIPRTQLAIEIHENLAKFPHCVLLTRVGQFYESYFDQAVDVARILNIKATTKAWGGRRVPMCGFPISHLDRHLKTLVQTHRKFVALCEEFKRAEGTFERRVTRVVTPGTLIDESFVNHYENNFLLAICPSSTSTMAPKTVGLAWTDVSTGEFFTQSTAIEELRDEIVRIGPKEVVLPSWIQNHPHHPISQALSEELTAIAYTIDGEDSASADGSPQFKASLPPEDLLSNDEPQAIFSSDESAAISLINKFLRNNLLEHMPSLVSPVAQPAERRMQIDAHTIKALEIKEGMREGGVTGSLFSAVKRTLTTSGTRLLARWLCSPSTSVAEIRARHDLVDIFLRHPHFRRDLLNILTKLEDSSRIVQRFQLGRGDTDDLLAIRDTIQLWNKIRKIVEIEKAVGRRDSGEQAMWANLTTLVGRISDLTSLEKRIDEAVDENEFRRKERNMLEQSTSESMEPEAESGVMSSMKSTLKEPIWTIKPDFSPKLTSLHHKRKRLLLERDELEQTLRNAYEAPSLTLRHSPFHGWHVHFAKIKDARRASSDLNLTEISKSRSTKSFFHKPWMTLGSSIATNEAEIYELEREAFLTLRSEVNAHNNVLRRNARVCDELDVLSAFAELADQMNFVRPTVNESTSYQVVNGRHPTVELGLLDSGRTFVPNSVTFDESSKLHIVTGPNMAGKSTILRQTALISILAQTGSFVPAESAEFGIVDKVFSRVGAKDDLFRDRSTFMVEMLETAEILKRATERSLVIMDEVGRGTTVKEGLAIAFATVHHLYTVNRCRALFATHFHDLVDILGYEEGGAVGAGPNPFAQIGFFCNDVDDTDDGYFTYSHRLRPGVNRRSHSLKVAQMAGMPSAVIQLAASTLSSLDRYHIGWNSDRDTLRKLGKEMLDSEKVEH